MNFYTLILHSNSFMSPLLSFINVFTIKFEQIRMIQITQNLELLDQKPFTKSTSFNIGLVGATLN